MAEPESNDALRPMAEENDRAALRRIVPQLFSRSTTNAVAALHAIAAILTSLPAEDLPWIEEYVRSSWRSAWHEPAFVADLLRSDESAEAGIMAVLSFHPSGYVREAAVNRLATSTDGAEVPYLLLRLNDWVPEVREAARTAILSRLRNDSIAVFTRNFFLVDRAIRARRADAASVADGLALILATDAAQAAVRSVIESGTRQTARAVVRFVIERVPGALPVVVRAGVKAGDPMIRSWATAHAVQAIPRDEALATLQRLTSDSSPMVRRRSLEEFAQSFPHDASPYLQRAVLDTSASVREAARFLLRAEQIDFRSIYEKALSTSAKTRQLAAAIAGLAETGGAADANTAASYLLHPSATVRRAALKCTMKLSGEDFVDRALAMLQDSSRPVSAAARDGLRKYVTSIGRTSLEEVMTRSPYRHARMNAVHLLPALPKWQSITSLVRGSISEDEGVAHLAREYVREWNRHYNRSQTSPSSREIEELNSALSAAETVLDRSIVDEIRFAVRAFS